MCIIQCPLCVTIRYVSHSRNISLYRSINGVCISIRQVEHKPKPHDTSTSDWEERRSSDPSENPHKDHHMRAATMAVVAAQELSSKIQTMALSRVDTDSGSSSSYYTPTPSPVVSPDRTLSPPNATTETVSPDCSAPPLDYEVATVQVSSVLTSAPPPPPSSSHTQGYTSYPPQSGEVPPRIPSPQAQSSYPQPNAYRTPSPYSGVCVCARVYVHMYCPLGLAI